MKDSIRGLSLFILKRSANNGETIPIINAIPAVNENDAYILDFIIGLNSNLGFTIPRCSNVLSLSPNAAPTFPRKSVKAGIISNIPGIATSFAFILTRILPVMLSPIIEINRMASDCLRIVNIVTLL